MKAKILSRFPVPNFLTINVLTLIPIEALPVKDGVLKTSIGPQRMETFVFRISAP